MAATNLINNLKVFGEDTTNKLTDALFISEVQRTSGFTSGTAISSKIMNTALRQSSVVTVALIQALKELTSENLSTSATFGSNISVTDAVNAIKQSLINIKINNAVLADNVKSGALVEETTIARNFKQGYNISLELNKRVKVKDTWAGTHHNNDIVYYGVSGALRGFYLIKGLSEETTTTAKGSLTITSGQTPSTSAISGNLLRLTYETSIGMDASLSKSTTITAASTDNQLATAKAVEQRVVNHENKTDNPHNVTKAQVDLENVTNDLQLKDSDRVNVIGAPTGSSIKIPTDFAVKTLADSVKTLLENHETNELNPHKVTKAQVGLGNLTDDLQLKDSDKVNSIRGTSNAENTKIPSELAVSNLMSSHLSENNPHDITKETVGLGLVENFAIATEGEATGESNDKYMTPLRTKDAIRGIGYFLTSNTTLGYTHTHISAWYCDSSSNITLTLGTLYTGSVAAGTILKVINVGTGSVTIDSSSSSAIKVQYNAMLKLRRQYESIELLRISSGWTILSSTNQGETLIGSATSNGIFNLTEKYTDYRGLLFVLGEVYEPASLTSYVTQYMPNHNWRKTIPTDQVAVYIEKNSKTIDIRKTNNSGDNQLAVNGLSETGESTHYLLVYGVI